MPERNIIFHNTLHDLSCDQYSHCAVIFSSIRYGIMMRTEHDRQQRLTAFPLHPHIGNRIHNRMNLKISFPIRKQPLSGLVICPASQRPVDSTLFVHSYFCHFKEVCHQSVNVDFHTHFLTSLNIGIILFF